MIVAIVALIAALAGGAYAAAKIGTKQIRKKAVTAPKLAVGERSEGFVFFDGANKTLPEGTFTPVASLSLPSGGTYFVTAQTSVQSEVGTETVHCQIRDDGTPVSRAINPLPSSGGTFAGTFTLTGPVGGGAIEFTCFPENESFARHRMITAIRIGTLESQ
jgi:hypothetical protein